MTYDWRKLLASIAGGVIGLVFTVGLITVMEKFAVLVCGEGHEHFTCQIWVQGSPFGLMMLALLALSGVVPKKKAPVAATVAPGRTESDQA